MTLLEKAMAAKVVKTRKPHANMDGVPELAIAWATDEIGISQVSRAFYGADTEVHGAYNRLATGLREAVRLGLLVPKEKAKR